ncbi:MAG: hypothetical protein ACO3R5_09795 [Pseudohongiellaceae bacterium]
MTLPLFFHAFFNYQQEMKRLPDFHLYNELVDFRPITSISLTASELKKFGSFTLEADSRETKT